MGSFSGGGGDTKPSPLEIELQEIADEEWLRYKQNFVPIENAFMEEVQTWDSPEERTRMAGEAAVMAKRDFGGMRSPIGVGFDQNSGGNFGLVMDNSLKGGEVGGAAAGAGAQAARNRAIAGKLSLMNTGRNIKDSGVSGLQRSVGIEAASERAKDRADWHEYRANQGAIGGAVGLATSYALPHMSNFAGAAPAFTGSRYNTDFGSTQSRMLAEQDFGLY